MSEEQLDQYYDGPGGVEHAGSQHSLASKAVGRYKEPRYLGSTRTYCKGKMGNKAFSRSGEWSSASALETQSHEDVGERRTGIATKKARFMRNGDEHFYGVMVVISAQRTRTFDSLLTELTRLMSNSRTLPQGVRFLFTLDGERIESLRAIMDDGVYVCSSSAVFRPLNYEEIAARDQRALRNREGSHAKGLNKVGTRCTPKHLSGDHAGAKPEFVHPRFIYIIRNGPRPRKIFRILLNKKTAISLDQVVNTISSKISLNTGAVRKLFTMRGEKVEVLEDFFRGDDIFFAYGQERSKGPGDFVLTPEEQESLVALEPKPPKGGHDNQRTAEASFSEQYIQDYDDLGEPAGNVDEQDDAKYETFENAAAGDVGQQLKGGKHDVDDGVEEYAGNDDDSL